MDEEDSSDEDDAPVNAPVNNAPVNNAPVINAPAPRPGPLATPDNNDSDDDDTRPDPVDANIVRALAANIIGCCRAG
jgi:hypothetical protein